MPIFEKLGTIMGHPKVSELVIEKHMQFMTDPSKLAPRSWFKEFYKSFQAPEGPLTEDHSVEGLRSFVKRQVEKHKKDLQDAFRNRAANVD